MHKRVVEVNLIDILNVVLKGNPLNSFTKLVTLSVEPHTYLAQWKVLDINLETIEKVIDIIKRYEANDLQLDGKGVWLLSMCLKYCYHKTEKLSKENQRSLVETLLRIALEQHIHVECVEVLQLILDKMDLTAQELFSVGLSFADQLPSTVQCGNFISLLNFGVNCMKHDSNCFIEATQFLSCVGNNVPFDYKVSYYLKSLCTTLYLPLCCDELTKSGKTFVDINRTRLNTLTLLTRLVCLSPTHAAILLDTNIPTLTLCLLENHMRDGGVVVESSELQQQQQLSPELISQVFRFFTSLCQGPAVRRRVCSLIPHSLLVLFLESSAKTNGEVLESLVNLFLTLNTTANFEQLYAGRPKKKSRQDMVQFLLRMFEISLQITRDELSVHVDDVSAAITASAENFLNNVSTHHQTSCFDMLNRIIRISCIHIKLNEVNELFTVIDQVLLLLMSQLDNFQSFNLLHINIFDSIVLLLGKKERCWWAPRQDPLDVDFQNVSAELVTQFSKVTANNKLFDTNDMKTLNYLAGTEEEMGVKRTLSFRASSPRSPSRGNSPIQQQSSPVRDSPSLQPTTTTTTTTTVEVEEEVDIDSDVVIGLKQQEAHEHVTRNLQQVTSQLCQHILILERFHETWETEKIEVTCRKLLLIFSVVSINGIGTMKPVFNISQLEEITWELLNDNRLGLEGYPDMRRKCVQLLTLVALQSPSMSQLPEILEYVIKILTSKEESNYDLPLMYACLSCLLALADKERTVRRKIITHFGKIYESFEAADIMDSLSPLLHLAAQMPEYMTKLELDGEQCLVTLIIRSLQSKNKKVMSHACDLICEIGSVSPGIIHRGVCRREVEDVLLSVLSNESVPHNPRLILSVLKACNAVVHDVNLKPYWLPNPWGYHWTEYKSNFSSRPILNAPFVEILLSVMSKALPSYRMLYFAVCLSIASSLMYNCSDGIVNPGNKVDVANLTLLKEALVNNILPWLPIAVDFITIGKKNSSSVKPPPNVAPLKRNSLGAMLDSTKVARENFTMNLIRKMLNKDTYIIGNNNKESNSNNGSTHNKEEEGFQSIANNSGTNSPVRTNNNNNNSSSSSSGSGSNKASWRKPETDSKKSDSSNNNNNNNSSSSNKAEELSSDADPSNPKRNLAMEYLTEKTVNGLYSFLCNDEMFPLSTYLRNVSMFQRTPVIACVSYFMTENKNNLTIQRRGMDFIKYFTDNQIGLSSIAMHSPSALMIACHALHDITDVQYTFCKIITAVSRSDDFARDNLIRFQVHTMLIEIILRQHGEQSRLACMAVTELCCSDLNVISICQNTGMVDAIVALLDALHSDVKIQVEGLRALCAINQVPEFLMNSKKNTIFQVLKKTKRFLLTALKNDKIDSYERADVEALLSDPLWNNEKCTIS